jgi:hypothetical protein
MQRGAKCQNASPASLLFWGEFEMVEVGEGGYAFHINPPFNLNGGSLGLIVSNQQKQIFFAVPVER